MIKPRIYCLVTADYELPLGRNLASPAEVLFEPTAKMMEVCKDLGIPLTFFPDICSVWAHRKFGLDDYAEQFEDQMRRAIRNGHDVQLHLHPHWLFATYQNGEWAHCPERMYLSECGFGREADSAGEIVARGINYLSKLVKADQPSYQCLAFRASGLALQPQERELLAVLLANGIRMDCSIAKGLMLRTDTVQIDYHNMPAQANWFMAPETGIAVPAQEGVLEIPIATFQMGGGSRLGFLGRRAFSLSRQRGTSISRTSRQTRLAGAWHLVQENLRYLHGRPWFIFSGDTKGFNARMLTAGFRDFVCRHERQETILVAMINHPKCFFAEQFALLQRVVGDLRDHYGDHLQFVTCSQAWQVARGNPWRPIDKRGTYEGNGV
jgi:hypothetical protein